VPIEGINLGIRLFIGGVLVIAAVGKLRNIRSFVLTVRSFRIVSRRWERLLAWTVVLAEIVTALLLAIHDWSAVGLCLAVLLMGAFTVAMLTVLARGERVACGCFGSSTVLIGKMHIVRNSFIILVAIVGIVASVTSDDTPVGASVFGIASAFAAFGVVLLVLLDQLLAIPVPRKTSVPAAGRTHVKNRAFQSH
jgi:hypothetical protein